MWKQLTGRMFYTSKVVGVKSESVTLTFDPISATLREDQEGQPAIWTANGMIRHLLYDHNEGQYRCVVSNGKKWSVLLVHHKKLQSQNTITTY